ncbi:MAG: threonylcarbamoyl-AMP synthase [Nanoarchaeota archaeon]|nr:threonylcarbamoyl-AMP synthase [Nanoarchaeota archaeon]MBU4284181.1 threonylcarbamoyl-AMP synthase [Nanoarchaeota archaeon]
MRIYIKEEVLLRKEDAVRKIRNGSIIVHPTDTIYGIGCNALDSKAVNKIRKMKKRQTMPFLVIAPSKQWIYDNCVITKNIEKWINKLPGRYTLILKLKNKKAVSKTVNNAWDTLGVRIPKHWFTALVEKAGVPFVTTSANIAGEDFMTSIDDLNPKIKSKVDFIVYVGTKKGRPSKIIDLTKEKPEIIKR